MNKLVLSIMFFFLLILGACANNNAGEEGIQRTDNLNISSIQTNSPNQDYSQTQNPNLHGQGYGNNFRPIGTQTENQISREQHHPQIRDSDRQKQLGIASTSDEISAFAAEVIKLTNRERLDAGLSILEIDNTLSTVAREKSREMNAKNYFSHTSPTYGSPFDMMAQYGVTYRSAAENIAHGQRSPQEVVQAWMNSEGHRQNILNGGFTHIGVGFEQNGYYWTQMFIRK